MYSIRGIYSPVTIHPTLFLAMGKQHQDAWKKVQQAQRKWQSARDAVPQAEQEARNAPASDEAAAVAAIRSGKPMPPPTTEAKEAALVAKQREVEALATLADEMERAFLDSLNADKEAITQEARTTAEELGERVASSLADALDTLEVLADVLGLWHWARGDDDIPLPTGSRLIVRVNGHDQSVPEMIETAHKTLTKLLPAGVEEQARQWAEYNASLIGQSYTADGLLIDHAARNTYSR